MTSLRDDLGFAARTLRKSPAFALTAILTIALGIGASTAIFSVVNAVLLESLPYQDPERLTFITSDLTARNVNDFPLPPGDYPDLKRDVSLFEETAAVVTNRQTFTTETGEPEMIKVGNVTTNFFRTLGARVIAGRDFVDADGVAPPPPPPAAPGAAPAAPAQPPPPIVVILSHGFWQRRFGGDPNIAGRTFRIGQQTAEIAGVLEPGFELLWPAEMNVEAHPDLYSALRIDFDNSSRTNVFMRVVGRLKPGATVGQAQDQVNLLVADLRKRFPVKEQAGVRWRVEPMHDYVVAPVKPALYALMGAVAFVLLIACANVANLLLVRTSQRERELAVRAALGSNRWALVRQMLVESAVIAGVGAAAGVFLAWGGTKLLFAIGPRDLPRLEHVTLNTTVLVFALVCAGLSALLFGIVPALRASRVNVSDILRTTGRSAGLAGMGKWFRNGVVVTEVALAFVLLVGSGLMMRSFVTLQRAEPGFDANGVLTFLIPNQGRPTPEARSALIRQIHDRLAAIPGVTGVSAANPLPLSGQASNVRWGTEAALANPALFQQADLRFVQPNYFEVTRTPIIAGQVFTSAENIPNQQRAVIDEVFAKKAFPGVDPVGKRFLSRTGGPEPVWYTVAGVVRHQRNASLSADSRETMYLSDGEFGFGVTNTWLVRTNGDPLRIVQAVRSEIQQIDRTIVMADVRPMADFVDQARAPTRFALICIGVFAVIAALLASVGLYGVLSTAVRQRTAEIGVRMAFGATSGSIFGLIVRQGVGLSAGGILLGLIAAFGLTRFMRTMVVGVGTTDPVTLASIALLFLVIATLACWLPARRASGMEPVVALRDD
jgi:putative ABC transport system permease protein